VGILVVIDAISVTRSVSVFVVATVMMEDAVEVTVETS
jgi:hypothetical protein